MKDTAPSSKSGFHDEGFKMEQSVSSYPLAKTVTFFNSTDVSRMSLGSLKSSISHRKELALLSAVSTGLEKFSTFVF